MRWMLLSLVVVAFFTAFVSCGWDSYDPRLGGSTTTGGSGGMGGAGGLGGIGGGGEGGVGGEGGGELLGCGRIDLLADAFDDGVTAPYWTRRANGTGVVFDESGGVINANPGMVDAWGYGYLQSRHFYDITDGHITVEVPQVLDGMTPAVAYLNVQRDGSNLLNVFASGGLLAAFKEVRGTETTLVSLPYNATAHRWWRIREEAGTVYWEVSADGASWTELATEVTSAMFSLKRVRVIIGVTNSGTVTDPGAAQFDNLQGSSLEGTKVWCPASNLSDDFDDGWRSDDWLNLAGSTQTVSREFGGELVFTLLEDAPGTYRLYGSSQRYDLTERQVAVEVREVTTSPRSVFLEVYEDDFGYALNLVDDELNCDLTQADVTEAVCALPYDPSVHRWWRLRTESDNIYWETSEDGIEWQAQAAQASPFPLTGFGVAFGATVPNPLTNANPGQAKYDNFNVDPVDPEQ